jgi:hypothetical protein
MTGEQRSIAVVLLICFIYGFIFWIQTGVFILPTPLFPLFSLIVGFYICALNFESDRYISCFIVLSLLVDFLCSPFFLMFVTNEEKFILFTNSAWLEIAKLSSLMLFLISGILYLLKEKSMLSKWLILSFSTCFISSIIFNSVGFYCMSVLALLVSYSNAKVVRFPLYYVAILLLFLRSVEWAFLNFAL